MTGIFHGVKIDADFAVNEEEALEYIKETAKRAECDEHDIKTLDLKLQGEDVIVNYTVRGKKFERIRRITGYLTGDVSRWNNAKKSELGDRVKHA